MATNIRKSASYPWTRIEGTAHSYGTYFYSGRFGCPVIVDCGFKTITIYKPGPYDCDGRTYKKGSFFEKCAKASRIRVYQMFKPLESKGWTVVKEV